MKTPEEIATKIIDTNIIGIAFAWNELEAQRVKHNLIKAVSDAITQSRQEAADSRCIGCAYGIRSGYVQLASDDNMTTKPTEN